MALVVKSTGNTIAATDVNQYHDLFTGVMTDQPIGFTYSPGTLGTTPVLLLKTAATNAPILQGYSGATQLFSFDASGNGVVTGSLSAGVVSSNPAFVVQTNGAAKVYGTGVINGGNGYAWLAQMLSVGGGAPGAHIWQGTTDPGASASEGDIWIVG
jgi:hypothetical protein